MIRWKQSEVTCREVVEVVNDYLTEVMPHGRPPAASTHLHAAPVSTYLEQMRATIKLTGRLNDDPLPAEVEAGLRAAFRARRQR